MLGKTNSSEMGSYTVREERGECCGRCLDTDVSAS